MAFRTAFQMLSSHQTRDLECFAESSSIPQNPWNPPTIRYPERTATILQTYLLSLHVWLFRQSHLFLICVVLTCNDSRIIPRKTCQIPRNCQCKWLLVSSSAPGASLGSSGSPGKFLYNTGMIVSTVLPNLVPPKHIDDCSQNVPLWVRLYQYVFCKTPSLISSSSKYRNLGPSESACRHYAHPNPVPLLLAAPLEVHEMTLKCLDFLISGFSKALLKYFHQPNSLWIPVANQAIHEIFLFVLHLIPHFYFVFGFCGFMQRVSPKLFTRTSTSFWYWIFGVSEDIKYGILWRRWWRSRWGCSWGRTRW